MKYPFIICSNVQCQCILGMKSWKLNSEIAPWPLWTTFFHACIINMFLWLFCICWFCLEFLYKSHRKKGELQSKLKFSSQIIALPYKKSWLSRNYQKCLHCFWYTCTTFWFIESDDMSFCLFCTYFSCSSSWKWKETESMCFL